MNATMVKTDGRALRAARNRAQIIAALMALIRRGTPRPSALEVAQEANISLRTVFRHFDDLESLYREMAGALEQEIAPILATDMPTKDWRMRLILGAERRWRVFDHILPVKVAADLLRFQSPFLGEDYARFLALERADLMAIAPLSLQANKARFAALELALSFDAWRRLRQDQSLSFEDAKAAQWLMVEALLREL